MMHHERLQAFADGLEANLTAVIQRAEVAERERNQAWEEFRALSVRAGANAERLERELAEVRAKIEGLTVDEDWTKDDHVARVNEANEQLQAFASGLELNLAAVIQRAEAAENKRDRLREALVECVVPLEVLHAIDCDLSPATQAGIGKAVTAIRAALFSAHPEPKPEVPKCEKCGGTGWVEDTSGYVDFMMCQVCQHTGKPYVECTRERKSK